MSIQSFRSPSILQPFNPSILQFFRSALATLCFAKNPSKASHFVLFLSKSLLFTHIWTKIALFSSKSLLFGHIWTKIVGGKIENVNRRYNLMLCNIILYLIFSANKIFYSYKRSDFVIIYSCGYSICSIRYSKRTNTSARYS